MGLSLFVGIWVARYLGPEELGLLRYAQGLVGLFVAVATLGTTQIVIRDLVNESEEEEGRILGTSFGLMLLAGITTCILAIGVGFWQNDDVSTRWLIIITSVTLIFQAFNVFDYWFQSKVLSKYSVYARTASHVTVAILKVTLILLSLNLYYFASTIVIAGVIQVILWIIYFQRVNNNLSEWQFDLAYAKNLLKNAWPLIITGISVAVYMKIDQVMLKNMVDANAVGNYSVAVTVSELWYFIPVTIASSVFPSIIKSKNFGTERYHRRMQYLYDVLTIVALVIALPMTFLSEFVISFLFGSEFSEASGVLAIYIWAGVFVFLGVVRSSWLINENYQSYGMFFTVLGAVSNVMINIWLIPIYGITGAAVATLISYMISAWLTGVIFQKTRIAFKMQCMAILRTVLIIPACHSFIQIYKEAKNSKS